MKMHDNMNKLKISEKFYNTEILNDRVGHDKMNLFAIELFCGYIFALCRSVRVGRWVVVVCG